MGHIGLPSEKETRFFDARYDRGVEWYCNLFGDYPADVPGGRDGSHLFLQCDRAGKNQMPHS